jgi:hypothetical protein
LVKSSGRVRHKQASQKHLTPFEKVKQAALRQTLRFGKISSIEKTLGFNLLGYLLIQAVFEKIFSTPFSLHL